MFKRHAKVFHVMIQPLDLWANAFGWPAARVRMANHVLTMDPGPGLQVKAEASFPRELVRLFAPSGNFPTLLFSMRWPDIAHEKIVAQKLDMQVISSANRHYCQLRTDDWRVIDAAIRELWETAEFIAAYSAHSPEGNHLRDLLDDYEHEKIGCREYGAVAAVLFQGHDKHDWTFVTSEVSPAFPVRILRPLSALSHDFKMELQFMKFNARTERMERADDIARIK